MTEEPTNDRTEKAAPPHREYYKSGVLEGGGDMMMRLYSIERYRDELGGTATRDGGFIAALKAYRLLEDDEWHDYAPNEAAEVLELAPEDYEVDAERSALLLRRLPPGMSYEARDVL